MQSVRLISKYAFFPLFIVIFDGAIYFVVSNGLSDLLLIPILGSALLLSTLAEKFIPYSSAFNTSRSIVTDTWHALVNEFELLALLAAVPLLVRWSSLNVWPKHWAFALQLLLAIVIFDFGVWLHHYASHRSALLWRFHAVHHSVTRLYSYNGLMKHPLHLVVEQAPGAIMLIGLGIPQDVGTALTAVIFVQLLLQHSNADYRIPLLEYFFSANSVHRFHHVNDVVLGNCNYGLFTNVRDMLFGTFRFSAARKFSPGELGLADQADFPSDYLGQLLAPFKQGG